MHTIAFPLVNLFNGFSLSVRSLRNKFSQPSWRIVKAKQQFAGSVGNNGKEYLPNTK